MLPGKPWRFCTPNHIFSSRRRSISTFTLESIVAIQRVSLSTRLGAWNELKLVFFRAFTAFTNREGAPEVRRLIHAARVTVRNITIDPRPADVHMHFGLHGNNVLRLERFSSMS